MSEKHRIKDYGVWIKGKGIKAVGSGETVMSRTTVASNVELLLRWIPAFAGMTEPRTSNG